MYRFHFPSVGSFHTVLSDRPRRLLLKRALISVRPIMTNHSRASSFSPRPLLLLVRLALCSLSASADPAFLRPPRGNNNPIAHLCIYVENSLCSSFRLQSGCEKMISASEREAEGRKLSFCSSSRLLASAPIKLLPGSREEVRNVEAFWGLWKSSRALPIVSSGGRRFPLRSDLSAQQDATAPRATGPPPLTPEPALQPPTFPNRGPDNNSTPPRFVLCWEVLLYFPGLVLLAMYRSVIGHAHCKCTVLWKRFCTAETTSWDKRGRLQGL